MRPSYELGAEVRVLRNVRNDGTYPGIPTGTLLIRRGSTGFVRDVGTFLQDQLIYSVHFLDDDRIVGCREEELQAADEPWTPSRFEARDRVKARLALAHEGEMLVEDGEEGEVIRVVRDHPSGVLYHVHFAGCGTVVIPESALDESASPEAPSPQVQQRA